MCTVPVSAWKGDQWQKSVQRYVGRVDECLFTDGALVHLVLHLTVPAVDVSLPALQQGRGGRLTADAAPGKSKKITGFDFDEFWRTYNAMMYPWYIGKDVYKCVDLVQGTQIKILVLKQWNY